MKKKLAAISLVAVLGLCAFAPVVAAQAPATIASAATTATGYTKASDVDYVKSGKYVANWGARDEDCVFLTSYATNYYTGSYTYDTLSKNAGSTSLSSVPNSALYKALHSMVSTKQTYTTSYDATRDLFCYTDCVSSNYSKISSFYSGKQISGTWDSGKTWNREHTWPNSKGDANGKGENDIMMLRPTSVSENSSRGNKAYGESSGYYEPNSEGQNVRGDCARIILYVYTRWGTANMWGSGGVMESKSILLKWMEEDPVDTWEMGRNDAVQAITGVRNVYVDYPEFAWLLFGESAPTDMVTPSGIASGGTAVPDTPVTPDDPETPTTPTTEEEIINAAYELAEGESLSGSYTLTGEITHIKQYDASTTNICLTMSVRGIDFYCYWMRDNANGDNKNLVVGDTITVTGTIKNYEGTIEFDKPELSTVKKGDGTIVEPEEPDVPTTPTTQKEIVDAAYALASGESLSGTYTLTGEIKSIKQYDTSTTNIWLTMTVEGKDIACYWMKDNANGDNKNLAVGDTITVTGIIKNYNGTVEFDKPTLLKVVKDGETPVEPDEPNTPETPVEPDEPNTPETPVEPDAPSTPDTPVTPDQPGSSTHPDENEGECAHSYSKWFKVGSGEEEYMVRFCTKCGHEERKSPEEVENAGNTNNASSGCGATIGGAFAGTTLLAAACVLFKKKRRVK